MKTVSNLQQNAVPKLSCSCQCDGKARLNLLLAVASFLLFSGLIFLFYSQGRLSSRLSQLDQRFDMVLERLEEVSSQAEEAGGRAGRAEEKAELAANLRLQAEARADQAHIESMKARREARQAREEAEQLRREREAELNRLQQALNRIAETRRTALGLVMNLNSDFIQFAFDNAGLTTKNKELISRIVGILLTSSGYRVHVYGHTDDIGSDQYNQELSKRRAQAVRDYMVEAGIDPDIITTRGYGKTRPIVSGNSPQARAKNRRVEIGIVDTTIQYEGTVGEN